MMESFFYLLLFRVNDQLSTCALYPTELQTLHGDNGLKVAR